MKLNLKCLFMSIYTHAYPFKSIHLHYCPDVYVSDHLYPFVFSLKSVVKLLG